MIEFNSAVRSLFIVVSLMSMSCNGQTTLGGTCELGSCSVYDQLDHVKKVFDSYKQNNTVLQQTVLSQERIISELRQQIQNGNCTPNTLNVDCADIKKNNPSFQNGTYNIQNGGNSVQVYCDMTTSGGGWTVFQRRMDGSENFYRPWLDYARGFGNIAKEFWMGNDRLASMTAARQYRLRVELGDWSGNSVYSEYNVFKVSNSTDKYRLTIGNYTHSGMAGDSLYSHDGQPFSTYDQDNDYRSDYNCAVYGHGAWWYTGCYNSNLNGLYDDFNKTGARWNTWARKLKFTEMKIRPVTF